LLGEKEYILFTRKKKKEPESKEERWNSFLAL